MPAKAIGESRDVGLCSARAVGKKRGGVEQLVITDLGCIAQQEQLGKGGVMCSTGRREFKCGVLVPYKLFGGK